MMPETRLASTERAAKPTTRAVTPAEASSPLATLPTSGSLASAVMTPTKTMAATTRRRAIRRRVSSAAGSLPESRRETPPPCRSMRRLTSSATVKVTARIRRQRMTALVVMPAASVITGALRVSGAGWSR